MMTAEIFSVGTELLLGNITDTNAAFIARELASLGIGVYRKTTVGDNHQRLLAAIQSSSAALIIITGGLGPTEDDITKEVVAKYFDLPLVLHEPSLDRIKLRFANFGRKFIEGSEKNAIIPQGALVLPNNNGSAPGVVVTANNKTIIMLPGPPNEMLPMFAQEVKPYLASQSNQVFISQTLKIIGIGESQVEKLLLDLIQAQTNPTIAPYAKLGEVELRITAAAPTPAEAESLIAPISQEIHKRLGDNIYSNNGDTLAETVLKHLKGQTLAVAESCTGGLLASEIVKVGGCSSVFMGGVCTYSNEAKTQMLDVDSQLIDTHGAVSPEVATAMAEGVAKKFGTSIGISTTGVAGPEGGTPDKPVGLVYIGLHMNGHTTTTKINALGTRNEIRQRAVNTALDLLRRHFT